MKNLLKLLFPPWRAKIGDEGASPNLPAHNPPPHNPSHTQGGTEKPDAKTAGKLDTSEAGKPDAKGTDKPDAKGTDKPDAKGTDKLDTKGKHDARTPTRDRNGILICGAYGLGNAGDEAILTAILREVRSVAPEAAVTVLSRNAPETAEQYGVRALHMFDLPGLHRALRETRLYINGGGSLIQDATSRRSLWYYLYTLHAAKARGCKVLMYGCGIGPVTNAQDRRFTRRVLNRSVDAVTLREADSLRELEALRVTRPEIILSADPALTLEPAPAGEIDALLEANGIPPRGRYVCFALREWKGWKRKIPAFREAARYAWTRHGLTPVFVSIEKRQDPAAHRPVAEGLDVPCYFLDDAGGPGTIIGALSRMEVVVSMRLHALIFAAGQGVPLVGVVYDPKVSAFLRYMEQDLFMDLDRLDSTSLRAMLDRAVERAQDRDGQAAAVARLRELEARNADTARRLLEQ